MDFKKVVKTIINDLIQYDISININDLSKLLLSLFKHNDNIFHYLYDTDLFKYLTYLIKPFISVSLFNQQYALLFIIINRLLNQVGYTLIDKSMNIFISIINQTRLLNPEHNHFALINYLHQSFQQHIPFDNETYASLINQLNQIS